MAFQGVESSKVEKPGELDNSALSRCRDESDHLPNDSSQSCGAVQRLPPKSEEFKGVISNEDTGSLKIIKNCDNNADTKSTVLTTFESKQSRSVSESDSTDIDLMPLRTRLSKKNALKKPKTESSDETTGKEKETDSITDSTEVDLILLSSRFPKKNALKKRKTAFHEATNKRKETDSFSDSDSTDVDSIPLSSRMLQKNTLKKPKTTCDDETTGKSKGEDYITDSTDVDSVPHCCRLSKKNACKKPRTASDDQATGERKGTDSIAVRIGDDDDFESPKAARNATGKRKGSEVSDDQDLLTSVLSTDSQSSSTSNREAKEDVNFKKRKTKKSDSTVDVSKRKVVKPAKKRITKRLVKTANRTTTESLEGED